MKYNYLDTQANPDELVWKALIHGYFMKNYGKPLEKDDYYEGIMDALKGRIIGHVVLEEKKSGGVRVALLRLDNKCTPYVVAWNYKGTTESWG